MFTGTPAQLKDRENQAGAIAAKIAALLDAMEELGLGSPSGQLHTPGGIIRPSGRGWTVTNR